MSDVPSGDVLIINANLTIPLAELQVRFSASRGPGGQHVNKTETKVTLLFDVRQSPSLSDGQRLRLLEKLAPRLDNNGVLQVTAQTHRSQYQNRAEALVRLQKLLAAALTRPKKRRPTKPSQAARERRLQAKQKRGDRKKGRGRDWFQDH
jgi:ribosome-associated protein